LNILDPAGNIEFAFNNETTERVTVVFTDSVEGDENAGEKKATEKKMVVFGGDVVDESVVEGDIGNGGEKAAVEAGVVAEEGSTLVDGEDGGDDLREKKEGKGEVEDSALPEETFFN
jgi:hypothetical protein